MHATCDTRECAAKTALENGLSGEMGGGTWILLELGSSLCPYNVSGTYTYETLAQQVEAGQINVKYIDDTVRFLLRTKFSLGLFESMCFWSHSLFSR